jgi:prepilin peptidase CpaA
MFLHLKEPALIFFLFPILLLAVLIDIRQRRIPNALTLPVIAVGMIYWSYLNGLDGFMHSTGGLLLGFAFLLPVYLFGGMGAGDVKLMGAVGSILGPQGIFIAFLYSAIVGGVYALFVLARSRVLKQTAGRYGFILRGYLVTGQLTYLSPAAEEKLPPLCYAVAISLGTILSVLRPL